MKKLLFILLVLTSNIFSQNICGTTELNQLTEVNKKVEIYLQNEILLTSMAPKKIIRIPIIFHVLYTDKVNISDYKILLLVNHLNRAYRMENLDEIKDAPDKFASKAADMRIEFYIDTIIRKKTEMDYFTMKGQTAKHDSSGGSNIINPYNYLNIWICDLSDALLGYGQFPGSAIETDGVVLDYVAVGVCDSCNMREYTEGDVAVHEIGHWLGLIHIWGDDCKLDGNYYFHSESCGGSDEVSDTPNQSCLTLGCPSSLIKSCKEDKMYMNYMDYTDNACMYMFTKGQVRRVRAILQLYRPELLD